MALKQTIIVRSDLKLPKGKLAAQVSHASVDCVLESDKRIVDEWRSEGMKKVVLKVESIAELISFKKKAIATGLVCCMITDAGKTVVEPGTITCIGIGPADEDVIDKITKDLKML